tara:strand:+ start:10652 stop:11581 length:930 start_codon:yes stop_codon:yes gene_type:complete
MYTAWLKGNLVVYPAEAGPVIEYFADTTNGSASNDGLSWERAKATVAQALALNTGRGLSRTYVAPGGYTEDHVTPLNATAPFGALIAVNPTPGQSFGAAYLTASTAGTAVLTIRARGWYISGFEIDALADAECIVIGGTTAGNNAAGAMIENCLLVGQNQGLAGIDWQSSVSGNPLVTIRSCGIYGFTSGATAGKCLDCTLSGIDQPRFALIEDNWFADSDNLIDMNPRGFKESTIRNNTFYTNGANQNPDEIIDNTGGNDTMIYGNKFSGAYTNAGGYVAGTNDNWAGNMANDVASKAANGWTFAVPA